MKNAALGVALLSAITLLPESQAADLAKEKEILCVAFASNSAGVAGIFKLDGGVSEETLTNLKFKYMLQAKTKYLDKLGVSMETLNSAQKRANDVDTLLFEILLSETEKNKKEPKQAFASYLSSRKQKLGCN